ncbi:UDP-N-acetylmuramate dehydrogenase [Rhizobium mongolense]|uniref:UDP-N-acetylenolpyruvoylglucosamine reductase n=1 Tax=Rhizobium mongolense TaxID=57676 RepID=A0A7W6RTX5_9HYPH|nr:UDP-N-acetylmuramate dehydrogenase [Rhizobium mongolense]MBB4278577.1 UDP-N-acetylmuramate dehydrogenase [Rhizobium mongolense]
MKTGGNGALVTVELTVNTPKISTRNISSLLGKIRNVEISTHVPLKYVGRWQIGGPADVVVEPLDARAVSEVLQCLGAEKVPFLVIGDGTNLLFDDAGFRGVVLRIGRRMSQIAINGTHVVAQAGIWTPVFARKVGCAGLTGAEHTVGIPGTLGGLVVMNGGSQRKGIGSNLVRATVVDIDGKVNILDRNACEFSYRKSNLQRPDLVFLEAAFEFATANKADVRRRMIEIMVSRRKKFPLRLPNCGSVFLSDPKMYDVVGPPGKAIEDAGLRGRRIGGAQIAPGHGNFIVNLGGATSSDVLGLIDLIRRTIFERSGFLMDCEVRHVRPDGLLQPAHLSVQSGKWI